MNAILGVLVVALFAYFGATLYRTQHLSTTMRSLIGSGVAFFAVGLALGPYSTDFLGATVVQDLDIVIDLGLGWVGLLFGLQLKRSDLRRLPGRHYLAAGVQSAVCLLVIGGGAWALALVVPAALPLTAPFSLPTSFPLPAPFPLVVLAGALAAIGSTSSPTTVAQIRQETRAHGPVTDAIQLIAGVDGLPAVLVAGALLCLVPPETAHAASSGALRLALAGGLGLLLGALFHLLTLYRYNENQLLVVLLGAVVFGGGAAHALRLSPLLVSVIIGAVLANLSPERPRMFRAFVTIEKPVYLILLTLAGAAWRPPPVALLVFLPAFLALRLGGKLLGGLAARPTAGVSLARPGRGLGLGLLGHGGMPVAIALDVKQSFPGTLGDLVLTATVVSVLAWSLASPWALRRLFAREGEAA